ncbi:MAG: hypothetical protein WAT57_07705, partial [Enterococcus aquimarinus]
MNQCASKHYFCEAIIFLMRVILRMSQMVIEKSQDPSLIIQNTCKFLLEHIERTIIDLEPITHHN